MKLPVIAMIMALALSGANPAEVYNEGNAKYRAGDYEGALGLYNSIATINPDLEYNRGAAYLKSGRLGKATVHIHRALKLRPGDKDAQASLEYIRSVKPDREKVERPGALETLIADTKGFVSINALSWMTICLLYLSSAAISIFMLWGGFLYRRQLAMTCAALIAMTVCGAMATAFMAVESERRDMAVAVEKSVDAFAEPSGESEKLFTFHEATACAVGRRDGGYVFVTLETGISGWVESSKLEII